MGDRVRELTQQAQSNILTVIRARATNDEAYRIVSAAVNRALADGASDDDARMIGEITLLEQVTQTRLIDYLMSKFHKGSEKGE